MYRKLCIAAIGVVWAALTWAHWPRTPLPADAVADRIVVHKADRTLELYRGDELLRTYRVSLGAKPVGPKRRRGDGRTPEGRYYIDYHKRDSAYHLALHITYPRPDQLVAARTRGEPPGELIMIHGLPDRFAFVGRFHLLKN